MWISKWEGIKFFGFVFLPFVTDYKMKPPEVQTANEYIFRWLLKKEPILFPIPRWIIENFRVVL